jgi:(1->4)-alpha-D-glucan 1-alpha-D-glucosylmutase
MLKAVREAKVNSSWTRPNAAYEEALVRFVDLLLQEDSHNSFLADMEEFQLLTSHCGMLNALSQTLLKITAPGIPDFYQGSELWDLSLVDPDNRRPVDFGLRRRRLEEIRQGEEKAGPLALARELVSEMRDGRIKLYLIRQALGLRSGKRELFERGGYLPLEVRGERADHLCAFERSLGDSSVIAVAPRFFTRLVGGPGELPLGREVWLGTRIVLPPEAEGGRYRNVFTGEILESERQEGGERLYLGEVLADFPVALLEKLPHPHPDPPLEGEGGNKIPFLEQRVSLRESPLPQGEGQGEGGVRG